MKIYKFKKPKFSPIRKFQFEKPLIFLAILLSSIITLTQVIREILPTYSLYLNMLAIITCIGIIALAFYESTYVKKNYIKVHKNWDIYYAAFNKIQNGEEIKLINSSFPDSQILFPLIEELLIQSDKKIKIKILLLDPRPENCCVEIRFKNRRETVEEERLRIESQISQLKKINSRLKKNGKDSIIEIKVYDNMIFGPLLQVGEKHFFIGLYLSNESAITGPLIEVNDSEGSLFIRISSHFNSLWETSREI